ncbi:MAG: LamG domain-containing protein [Fibrobacterales bacterium]
MLHKMLHVQHFHWSQKEEYSFGFFTRFTLLLTLFMVLFVHVGCSKIERTNAFDQDSDTYNPGVAGGDDSQSSEDQVFSSDVVTVIQEPVSSGQVLSSSLISTVESSGGGVSNSLSSSEVVITPIVEPFSISQGNDLNVIMDEGTEGSDLFFKLKAINSLGESIKWGVVERPPVGDVSVGTTGDEVAVSYRVPAYYNGVESFLIVAEDGQESDTIVISVTVSSKNTPPQFTKKSTISGIDSVRKMLSISPAECVDTLDGAGVVVPTYGWYRSVGEVGLSEEVLVALATEYTLVAEDKGHYMYVVTSCEDVEGESIHDTTRTINKIAAFRPPFPGNAMKFNGSNQYVVIDTIQPVFTNGLTFELWVNWYAIDPWARLIEITNAEGLADNNIYLAAGPTTGELRFDIFNGTWLDSAKHCYAHNFIAPGEWIHVAASVDASGFARIYKNGVEVKTCNTQAPVNTDRAVNFLGKSNSENDRLFLGAMDEVRIWNDVRTPDEIIYYKDHPLEGDEENLVLYYDFFDYGDGKLTDVSGSVHGTYVNMVTGIDSVESFR